MDGILPVLIAIIGILSSIAKAQKKKEAAKKKQENPAAAVPGETVAPPPAASVPMPAPAVSAPQPMPQWTPVPAVMGPEGEDACHEYMLDEEPGELAPDPAPEADSELARDLVKGVIIGEILNRPRMYGRRRA